MSNQTCRLCKKEKEEQQFQKNGRTLKSCEDCRLVVREAKFLKKQKKSDDSGSSSDDNTTEAHTLETVEEVGVEETKEDVQEPVQEPVQESVPDVPDVPDVEEVEEEVFVKVNKPTKTVLRKTKAVVVKEKNLPTTKRVRKPRTKKE